MSESVSKMKPSSEMKSTNFLIFVLLIKLNSATHEKKEPSILNQLSDLLSSCPMYTIFSFVSLVSLILVFIIFMVVPGLNNLFGKIIMSNVVSIALYTTSFLAWNNIYFERGNICKIFGYFYYFSATSMFSWMTVLSFHLFCSTLDCLPCARGFMLYSVMGWGSGMVLTLGLFCLEIFLPSDSDFNPAMGDFVNGCFISSEGNKSLFLFGIPTLVMMIINISFFIIIIISNIRDKQKLKQLESAMR